MITRSPSRALTGVLIAAVVVGLSACGMVSANNLQIGQCINDEIGDQEEVTTVPVVDCAEPHTGEVYSLPELPDGDYPGVDGVTQSADQLCSGPDFENYVGVPFDESEIPVSYIFPSEDTWGAGDREITCVLATEEGTETTGSLRGASR